MSNSVMVSPVEGSTLPRVFLCILVLQAEVLLVFDVLFLKQVLYYSLLGCGLRTMWPSTKKNEYKCFKLVYILQCMYCSSNKYCLQYLSDVT